MRPNQLNRRKLKYLIRAIFATLILVSGATVVQGYITYSSESEELDSKQSRTQLQRGSHLTVVTTSERRTDGERDNALIAYTKTGDVAYYNDSHRVYNDVDPVEGTHSTVLYVASNRLERNECSATTACWQNIVEEVNLTTGETTRHYTFITALGRGQWHDVDRVGNSRFLIADIALDRAFVVNTTSGITEWEWHAQNEFPLSGGGLFPGDWTHVNDVERLKDGRVMVSLRNQDQVVFIHPQHGLQENWTLGSEDDYDILYEQHNPDYIPAARGGPAVLVADSENNRVVEYCRTNSGTWKQSWSWEDEHLMWPRDVDRLPNGHTLITDSNGGRIVEVNKSGEIVWQVKLKGAYDAERLGTGDESTGGHSVQASLPADSTDGKSEATISQTPSSSVTGKGLVWFRKLLPRMLINPLLYVLPSWVGFVEFTALLLGGLTGISWATAELWWSPWSVRFKVTHRRKT
ncbi:Arylsulfotransferase (ASST) [Halogranum rubrum]|uniref:Arylsulfotransferase (ASST) n=1 Tax=Halogranum rubrum TaxID=553466 RepID=A0A1I4HV27_9EURY|nr:arylsulfotransferase family protein [Halogranum rubrum]SFL45471.1 Arylsulfotransferase (ASST) [Halogranum rubrum]